MTTASRSGVPDRHIEYVPLDELEPAARNPKRHQGDMLRGSIGRFGFATPALRDERTGRLVVGHGRTQALAAMREAGETAPEGIQLDNAGRWLVPVVCGWASRSDAEADAYLVADNRHSELGGWDNVELAELLSDLNATDVELLEATGYSADELTDLLNVPTGLDDLAEQVGDPAAADTWPTIRLHVPPHLAAAWREHLSTHDDREVDAFAALLGVDAEAPAVMWAP